MVFKNIYTSDKSLAFPELKFFAQANKEPCSLELQYIVPSRGKIIKIFIMLIFSNKSTLS